MDNKIQGHQRISTQQELHDGDKQQSSFLDGNLCFTGKASVLKCLKMQLTRTLQLFGSQKGDGFIDLFCKTKYIKLPRKDGKKKKTRKEISDIPHFSQANFSLYNPPNQNILIRSMGTLKDSSLQVGFKIK